MAKKARAKPKKQYTKGWETRRRNAKKKKRTVVADALAPTAEAQAVKAVREDWDSVGKALNQAMFGDSSTDTIAEELVKLARSKGGKDKVYAKVRGIQAQAEFNGKRSLDEVHTKRLVEVQQRMADSIVCGFIAEVDAAQKYYSGLPKDLMWSINSFTVLRIVDALNAAGYSAKGRNVSAQSVGPERALGTRHAS